MLQLIRTRAQGIFAWVIVILISVPFALWGISNYFSYGADTGVAKIGDREISQGELLQSVENQRQRLRDMLGESYRPEMINDEALKREVLQRIVEEQVVAQAAREAGFRISNQQLAAEIQSIPAFQTDGRFDFQAYEERLRMQGMSVQTFEARMRQSLIPAQFYGGVQDTAFTTNQALDQLLSLQNQQRDVTMLRVPLNLDSTDAVPTDDEVADYYAKNNTLFTEPEKLRARYVELSAASLQDAVEISEADLQSYYDSHKSELAEQRQWRASHILVAVDGDTDEAAALAKAQDIHQQLIGGADFAELAKANSDDPGSAQSGGDLGFFGAGLMVEPFQKAVEALTPGALSEPVKTDFGYHIIRLDEIKGGDAPALAAVRDRLLTDLKKERAEQRFFELADKLINLSFENSGTLLPAADGVGLEVKTSDWFSRSRGEGLFANPKLRESAFAPEVRERGLNSEAIELSPTHVVVLRVEEQQPSFVKPLDEVRDQVVKVLAEQKAREAVRKEGEALLAALGNGGSIDTLAAEQGLKTEKREGLTRQASGMDNSLTRYIFQMRKPADGAQQYGGLQVPSGDYVVVALNAVRAGGTSEVEESVRDSVKNSVTQLYSNAEVRGLVDGLRSRADVSINEKNL